MSDRLRRDRESGRKPVRALRAKSVQAAFPGGVEVGAWGEALVELEDCHAVGEGPGGAGEVEVAAQCLDDGSRGALLGAGGEVFAVKRAFGHQAVQVGVPASEVAVGGAERADRIVGVRP